MAPPPAPDWEQIAQDLMDRDCKRRDRTERAVLIVGFHLLVYVAIAWHERDLGGEWAWGTSLFVLAALYAIIVVPTFGICAGIKLFNIVDERFSAWLKARRKPVDNGLWRARPEDDGQAAV